MEEVEHQELIVPQRAVSILNLAVLVPLLDHQELLRHAGLLQLQF